MDKAKKTHFQKACTVGTSRALEGEGMESLELSLHEEMREAKIKYISGHATPYILTMHIYVGKRRGKGRENIYHRLLGKSPFL